MSIKKLVWFASAVVLLEFATYASNDMILPAMPNIVKDFGGTLHHISLSMSLYILGCACFQLFVAPLAEYYGQRQMLSFGTLYFTVFTVVIIFSKDIYSFLGLRFIAGASMSFSSLGYAFINRFYDDKQATRIISLMQNFTIVSPLAGPMIGVFIIGHLSWHYIFVFTALLGLISFFGMNISLNKMPRPRVKIGTKNIMRMYLALLKRSDYVLGSLVYLLMTSPPIIWIATSTTVIKTTLKLDNTEYIILQFLALGGVLVGPVLVYLFAGKMRFANFMLVGISIAIIGITIGILFGDHIYLIAVGLLVYGLGSMIFNTLTMRILGTIPFKNTNMIFTLLTFIKLLGFFVAIIIAEYVFSLHHYSVNTYSKIWIVLLVMTVTVGMSFIYKNRNRQWQSKIG